MPFTQGSALEQIAGYLESVDEEDCARMRETWQLWRARRRRERRHALTGHFVSILPLRPSVAANPNWLAGEGAPAFGWFSPEEAKKIAVKDNTFS